jgi:nicotinamide mononucleotide transporter
VVFVLGVYFFYYLDYRTLIFKDIIRKFTWVNYIDAITTSIFFAGMWLMAKRKIENWILWIIGDIMVIPMFFHKNLEITALQYMIFLILAIKGYQSWQKEYNSTHNATH